MIINSQEIPDGEVITIIITLKREKDGRFQSGEIKRMMRIISYKAQCLIGQRTIRFFESFLGCQFCLYMEMKQKLLLFLERIAWRRGTKMQDRNTHGKGHDFFSN